jgi:hypothetical protein
MIRRYTLEELEQALGLTGGGTDGSANNNANDNPNTGGPSGSETGSDNSGAAWWHLLSPADKDAALGEILALPEVIALADTGDDDQQPNWRVVVAACARSGAPNAHEQCRDWAKQSSRYFKNANNNDSSFDTRFNSYARSSGGPGGITMGSLILIAHRAGWDSTGWRAAANHNAPPHNPPTGIPVVSLPITSIPTSAMTAAVALAEMNRRLFVAHLWGNEPVIGYEGPEGVRGVSRENLQLMLANRFVTIPGPPKKVSPLADWWLKNAQRREFDRVIYDPENTLAQPGERTFNLWTGFAITPQPGRWTKMGRHLLNIVCKGDQARFCYLIYWLAHAVQHPGTAPGSVIVLLSEAEGAGKSILGEWMVRILGNRHGIMLSDPEHLVGTFNDHLEGRSFICLNEPAFPGEHTGARKFKSMITETTWLLNGKYRKPYLVSNIAHIMLTTNADWAVPAGNKARRFAVFDVDEGRVGDHVYFKDLWDELDNGGLAALLHFLLHLDVSQCNLRAVPYTQALINQQLLSASSQTQWALDSVEHGAIIGVFGTRDRTQHPFNDTYQSSLLHEWYSAYTKARGMRPIGGTAFGRWLSDCGFRRTTPGGLAHWHIPDALTFFAAVKKQAGIL